MRNRVSQAVVLAGGEGTRLRPLTNNRPKPLLPVLGRPCVEYILRSLAAGGITKVYMACAYKSMDVVRALGDGKEMGIDLTFAFEEQPMGTAGAVKLLEQKLDQTFVVVMGDNIMDIDLEAVIRTHQENEAMVTIALTEVEKPTEFGIVGLDERGRITRFKEKPASHEVFSNLINAGLYVIEKEAFAYVPEHTKFDFSKNLFPKLLEAGHPLYGSRLNGLWKDIGRPKDLLDANIRMAERRGQEINVPGVRSEGRIVAGQFKGQEATIIGPSYIGEGVELGRCAVVESSAIGAGCKLEEGAWVKGSLILDGSSIGSNAVLEGCIIGQGCRIGKKSQLRNCILGDLAIVPDLSVLEDRTLE